MLIKVFGIWLVASNIVYLDNMGAANCRVVLSKTNSGLTYVTSEKPCDETATEINKEILKTREGM